MMNKTAYRNTLTAIAYTAYESTQGCITIHDNAEVCACLMVDSFDAVINEMHNERLVGDVDKLYNSIPYLSDCEYLCEYEGLTDFDNMYNPILNAILYTMKQVFYNQMDILGIPNLTDQCTALLRCYYWYLSKAMYEAYEMKLLPAFDEHNLYCYDEGMLEMVKRYSGISHELNAWLYMTMAKNTAEADWAWKLVDEAWDWCLFDKEPKWK